MRVTGNQFPEPIDAYGGDDNRSMAADNSSAYNCRMVAGTSTFSDHAYGAAVDINPVAWFILKCTLEYPQRLAGQKRPLPEFALRSTEFMREFQKATMGGVGGRKDRQATFDIVPDADLSWHVRAWSHWVLERAKADLARRYPLIDGKPTVVYLWARTVPCKGCRATIPLRRASPSMPTSRSSRSIETFTAFSCAAVRPIVEASPVRAYRCSTSTGCTTRCRPCTGRSIRRSAAERRGGRVLVQ